MSFHGNTVLLFFVFFSLQFDVISGSVVNPLHWGVLAHDCALVCACALCVCVSVSTNANRKRVYHKVILLKKLRNNVIMIILWWTLFVLFIPGGLCGSHKIIRNWYIFFCFVILKSPMLMSELQYATAVSCDSYTSPLNFICCRHGDWTGSTSKNAKYLLPGLAKWLDTGVVWSFVTVLRKWDVGRGWCTSTKCAVDMHHILDGFHLSMCLPIHY